MAYRKYVLDPNGGSLLGSPEWKEFLRALNTFAWDGYTSSREGTLVVSDESAPKVFAIAKKHNLALSNKGVFKPLESARKPPSLVDRLLKEDSPFGDVISSYSRAQALEDGELVDVSKIAKEAGIKFPTAVTRNLFTKWIEPSAEDKKYGQDLQGRLWDVVYMFTVYAKRTSGSRMIYPVIFAKGKKHVTVKLLAILGPGDTDAPTATIMLPEDE